MEPCTNVNDEGGRCQGSALPGAPVSLCQTHLIVAAHYVMEMGGLGTGIVAGRKAGTGARLKYAQPQVVYYLMTGSRIKIGTTTNLRQQLQGIAHDRVLAIEPGGNALERRRHGEFASSRIQREWFRPDGPLLDHILDVRREHGEDPMKAWEDVVARHADSGT